MTNEDLQAMKTDLAAALGPDAAAVVLFAWAGEIGRRLGITPEQHQREVEAARKRALERWERSS
jgi:hypothetical protein